MKRILVFVAPLAAFLVAETAFAQTANPFPKPPPVAAPRTVSVPKPVETKLPNGLRVIAVERPGSGLVSVRLLLPQAGSASTTYAVPGTAQAVAELLTKGTKSRTATQIAEEAEQIG
ncbi:MAG: insulinase family protein, partial [Armatimonadetes bacterium]|nr:insulinase family protein [Armatimonadota bacterium]